MKFLVSLSIFLLIMISSFCEKLTYYLKLLIDIFVSLNLLQYKLPQEDIIRHKNPQILSDLVYEVASQAFFHLEKVSFHPY